MMLRRLCSTLAIWCLLLACLWLLGLVWFFSLLPSARLADPVSLPKADAIVVLTGGKGRLEQGLKLMETGRAPWMLVSGVFNDATRDQVFDFAVKSGSPYYRRFSNHIIMGRKATDTHGNASEAAEWLRARGFKSALLVTSNYHMPRSLFEFQRAVPEVTLVPAPSFSVEFTGEGWWRSPEALGLILSEYHKYLVVRALAEVPAAAALLHGK